MPREIELLLSPEQASDDQHIEEELLKKIGTLQEELVSWSILRKSIDARKRPPVIRLRLAYFLTGDEMVSSGEEIIYRDVHNSRAVAIVGAGPAGLFAALKLIEQGLKPIIFERGKDVRERRRDLAALNKEHIVNPESNYCFGEGGAGTYSDGKLYTRSTKRGDVKKILDVLVNHGAPEAIRYDAHPHIGTNKLPGIITKMRETILEHGGEVRFHSKMTDLFVEDGKVVGLEINGSERHDFSQVILATGHSARDVFELLHRKEILIEFKPFALGVRVEHPQVLIDRLQYHCDVRGEFLPPASYSVVTQVNNKGVYSFCMCPGGIIAPCATDVEEVVTNGWSPSKRNNPWANSGIVTQIGEEELGAYEQHGSLKGLQFQKEVERACWEAGGKTQKVPAQRLKDFVDGKLSDSLPDCSYQPGIVSARVDLILPDFVSKPLKRAFIDFGKKMRGYLSNEAVVVAPESRTSSPVRIPRDKESLMHPEVGGLYPCAEGAGYAGGIVSAAMDGEKVAERVLERVSNIR